MKTLSTLSKIFKLAFEEKLLPTLSIYILILLTHTFFSIYQLKMEKDVINKIYYIENETIAGIIIYILLFFLVKNLLNILYQIRFFISARFGPRFAQKLRNRMYDKVLRLNLIYFEDSELYNLIEKSKRAYHYSVTSFTNAYQSFFGHVASVFGIMIYLTYLNPVFIFIIIFASIPKIIGFKIKAKKRMILENEQAPVKRQVDYYDSCITNQKYFKETRLFGSYDYFLKLWSNAYNTFNSLERKNNNSLFKLELLFNFLNFISYVGTFSLAIVFFYNGSIGIGSFAAVLSALTILDERIGKIVKNTGQIIEEAAIASYYFTFLDLDENCGNLKKTIYPIEEIEFKNVSFKYPSKDRFVIDNINLKINKGERIAIVGLNGAGKTTFVKLLLGLLIPTSGKVLYNNKDIESYDIQHLHQKTSTLFQTFAKYFMTIRENVGISDSEKIDDLNDIKASLEFANFNLNDERFSLQEDTLLGKEFGGTELSGGQWQLIALARAYFRDNGLIILDEPTSAIDPILENEIFLNFKAMSENKTAIIVTHRLGISKIANRILVFDQGKIIEDGSFNELMELKGHYYNLFKYQKEWYERNA